MLLCYILKRYCVIQSIRCFKSFFLLPPPVLVQSNEFVTLRLVYSLSSNVNDTNLFSNGFNKNTCSF